MIWHRSQGPERDELFSILISTIIDFKLKGCVGTRGSYPRDTSYKTSFSQNPGSSSELLSCTPLRVTIADTNFSWELALVCLGLRIDRWGGRLSIDDLNVRGGDGRQSPPLDVDDVDSEMTMLIYVQVYARISSFSFKDK